MCSGMLEMSGGRSRLSSVMLSMLKPEVVLSVGGGSSGGAAEAGGGGVGVVEAYRIAGSATAARRVHWPCRFGLVFWEWLYRVARGRRLVAVDESCV